VVTTTFPVMVIAELCYLINVMLRDYRSSTKHARKPTIEGLTAYEPNYVVMRRIEFLKYNIQTSTDYLKRAARDTYNHPAARRSEGVFYIKKRG
jgi:hypothetical protein